MLRDKMTQSKETGKSILHEHSGEYILLLFMCVFSVTFLVAAFLFLTTGDEMIFLHDARIPFLSSSFQ
ncbi:MAG: hypothetical protein SD837_21650 [Candidatus Electrothrix scaldis]|nr:MAG: hypothetical protein SD837_21650 [Candidatus Electrothrix sp. GW3-3]